MELKPGCRHCTDDDSKEEAITEKGQEIWSHERCRSMANCSKEFACRKWDVQRADEVDRGDGKIKGHHDGGDDGPAIGVAVGLVVAAVAVTVIAAFRGNAFHASGQPYPDGSSAADIAGTSKVSARAVAPHE